MSERPVLFSGPMVRAILNGRKSQTRRVIKPQPSAAFRPLAVERYSPVVVDRHGEMQPGRDVFGAYGDEEGYKCPYGAPGDRLWVRETWRVSSESNHYSTDEKWLHVAWRAGSVAGHGQQRSRFSVERDADLALHAWGRGMAGAWRPSIHMPRWASRLTLEVTDVRVELVQEISHADALAEGVAYDVSRPDGAPVPRFRALWDSINAKRGYGWDVNPWVWVISFRRVEEATHE